MSSTLATAVHRTRPACPPWCAEHTPDGEVHLSEWRVWESSHSPGWSPRVELQMYRGDDVNRRTGEAFPGTTDFNIRIVGRDRSVTEDGSMECRDMRELGAFLIALADEIDPHHRNGEPLREKAS